MSFLQTLRGGRAERTPVWIMRQAGRYLPEYRALRERYSFLEMTRTPEIAAEVTLQPLRRFPLDAAIVFSDIMTPLEALGVEVEFAPAPMIAQPLRSPAAIAALRRRQDPPAPFVGHALRIARAGLPAEVALIGFCGAPLTLAAYLIEGSGAKEYEHFRAFMRAQPEATHVLLERLTELSIAYLLMQIAAGADTVQLFDSWAGLHDEATYRAFGLPYNRRIMEAVGETGAARIYFALGAAHLLDAIAEIPAEGVGVDWRTDLRQARRRLPGRALQGNLDPAYLFADAATLEAQTQLVLEAGRGGPHVFNLGHGIWPGTPIEAVSRLVERVHSYPR